MIIYRVEHPVNQKGPYNTEMMSSLGEVGSGIIDEMADNHRNNDHPSLCTDEPPETRLSFDHYCAFDSFDKLLWWFEGYIDYLLDMGFQIVQLEVPDSEVVSSRSLKQVFFRRDQAKILNVLF